MNYILFALTMTLFSPNIFALKRPFTLSIDGQVIDKLEASNFIYGWNGAYKAFVFNDFSEVVYNGKILEPHILKEKESLFLRADDGSGDYQLNYLQQGPLRRAILCEIDVVIMPDGIEVKDTAGLKRGDAVLAFVLDDSFGGQGVKLFVCGSMGK